jgi:dTDP-4-amino-4,6-dideoxygalactose transaminase
MELGSDYHLQPEALAERDGSVVDYLAASAPIFTDSGRSALRIIGSSLRQGKVLLPEYICQSVIESLGIENVAFYRLRPDLQIDVEDLMGKADGSVAGVMVMHYHGSTQSASALSAIAEARRAHGFVVIEDSTHSFLGSPRSIGDFCVCSLRKSLAIPQGGALYSGDASRIPDCSRIEKSKDNSRINAMALKAIWIDGLKEPGLNAAYRRLFAEAEARLDAQEGPRLMSDLASWMLRCASVEENANRRKDNYRRLLGALLERGIAPICALGEGDVPFSFPLRIGERDRFRRHMADKSVYCAVHWPMDPYMNEGRPLARALAHEEISLPIDQRYSAGDMDYLADAVLSYEGNLSTCGS